MKPRTASYRKLSSPAPRPSPAAAVVADDDPIHLLVLQLRLIGDKCDLKQSVQNLLAKLTSGT